MKKMQTAATEDSIYRPVFDKHPDALIIVDDKSAIVKTNQSAQKLLGFPVQDLQGRDYRSFLSGKDKKHTNSRTETHGILQITPAQGKRVTVHYSFFPRIQAHRHLLLLQPKKSGGSQGFEQVIGLVSHELRTPLASIKAYAHILTRLCHKSPTLNPATEYVQKIDEKTNLLTKLIGDLLDVSRIQQGTFDMSLEILEIDGLLNAIVKDIQIALPHHSLALSGKTNVSVIADRNRITQVLTNLIKNAANYSEPHKPITITLRCTRKNVYIDITDRGIGIPKTEYRKIFMPYYQGTTHKHTEPSLGVGLFVSSQIIKQHGGTITVASKPNHGSTFTITLPVPAL